MSATEDRAGCSYGSQHVTRYIPIGKATQKADAESNSLGQLSEGWTGEKKMSIELLKTEGNDYH